MQKINRIIFSVILCVVLLSTMCVWGAEDSLSITSKGAILMDFDTGTILYEKNAKQRLPVASITKVMTLCLIFDAVEAGRLKLDDMISVSERAAGMGGSQAFIESNYSYKAAELIKSIIVASANDSAVAMAEHLAGCEDVFVAQMNKKASALGMKDTVFKNCTGLPAADHLSTAADVALMSCELLKHEDYFKWSTIWMDKIVHKDARETELVNTNRLIRSLQGCDGVKTGSTSEARFCVSATAKRGDMRLIAVVLGGDTSKTRFDETARLINYGFANFLRVKLVGNETLEHRAKVNGGVVENIAVRPVHEYSLLRQKTSENDVKCEVRFNEDISAPVAIGDTVGEIVIIQNGKELARVPIAAAESCAKAGFWDKIKRIFSGW